jgi:hypothetical protein
MHRCGCSSTGCVRAAHSRGARTSRPRARSPATDRRSPTAARVRTNQVHAVLAGLGDQVLGQLLVQAVAGEPELPLRRRPQRLLDRRRRGRPALAHGQRVVIFALHRTIQSGHHPKVVDHHGSSTSTRFPTVPSEWRGGAVLCTFDRHVADVLRSCSGRGRDAAPVRRLEARACATSDVAWTTALSRLTRLRRTTAG